MAKASNTVTRWRRLVMSLAVPSLLLIGVVLPSSVSAACPNEAIRETQTSEALPLGSTVFPACMGLEMLSVPKKFGQEALELSAFSPDSTRALYKSKAALADTEGLQSFIGDYYVGARGTDGWSTQQTSPPASAHIQVGGANFGGPFAFTPDLGAWAMLVATQAQQYPAEGQFFTDGLSASFMPLSPLLAAINDSGDTIQYEIANIAPSGVAADMSAAVFVPTSPDTTYLPGAPSGHSYLAALDGDGNPTLQLLARDGTGTVYGGRCGSALGNAKLNQGAISADGSRIYFSTRPAQPPSVGTAGPPCDTDNPLRIMVRTEALTGPTISELISGGPSEGDDLYQGASLDGSKVFFASPRKLAASDQDASSEACSSTVGASKGCDLYLYDGSLPPADRLTQISAGENVPGQHEVGKGADVLASTVSLAPDGSHAYFVAQGVLTAAANPAGASAVAGKPNLYVYDSETKATSFIATLAEADKEKLWGLAQSFANWAYSVPLTGGAQGGDGHVLFLTSKAPLTSADADTGFSDIFRYDSEASTLECISCSPESPDANAAAGFNESLLAPPSSNFAEQGRWASEDGQTIAFATAQPLVPGDEDGKANPYLWKEGQLTRLPGNVGPLPAERPMLSSDGEIAGFITTDPLLSEDGDTARDVYLLRVNGGFLPPPAKPICDPLSEGACQGPATPPPPLPTAATSSFSGPGNPKAQQPCKKGKVRKRGRCVKPRAKKAKTRKAAKRANSKHRGEK